MSKIEVRIKEKDLTICVQKMFAKWGTPENQAIAKENLKKLGVTE